MNEEPVPIVCDCGSKWDQYSIEWPPKLIICPNCSQKLKLEAYDPEEGTTVYRRL